MKQLSTEDFLTLGMALTGDKKTMERRVRGVFGRQNSARAAKILALALCIALGIGCFTTACQPAQEAKAQPSAIPLETEEQAASAEAADTAAAQNAEREDVSFLSGLTESDDPPSPYPTRIEREAVSLDKNSKLAFDADVIVPETDGCGIARLERHVFSDQEYQAFMDYVEPDADWRTDTLDGGPFSFEAAEHFYNAVAQGEDGYTSVFMAARGDRTLYYSKYDSVMPQSGFQYDIYVDVEAEDFNAEWPMEAADAQPAAEQVISDLGIENMTLVGAEKAVSYDNKAEGTAGMTLQTRGWMFYFAHEFNGLSFGNMNCVLSTGEATYSPLDYGVLSVGDTICDPPDYQTPMWERLSVYVDETGIAEVDWEDALDITETVLHNVSILSPDQAADCLTARLREVYVGDGSASEATFRVTAVRLGAAAIGEFPLPAAVMSANQGLMVPCWELETVVTDQSGRHTEVYVFNAVDGGTLVGKVYHGGSLS